MTEQTNFKDNRCNGEIGSYGRPLMGTVILLIGNDTAVLHTLVTQLAQKGADIALVCRDFPREAARRLKQSVETVGQRFLLINEATYKRISASHLIQLVTSRLGHLDAFIDLSAQQTALPGHEATLEN